MTDRLLAGLIIALVSALTLVAYRHPRGYRKIAGVALPLLFLYGLGRSAGDLGAMNANIQNLAERVQQQEPSIQMIKFTTEMLAKNYTDLKWTLVITALTLAYMVFLIFLPNILEMVPAKAEATTETKADTEQGQLDDRALPPSA